MLPKDIQCLILAQDAAHRPVSMQLIAALLSAVSPRKTSTITTHRRSMAICFGLAVGL